MNTSFPYRLKGSQLSGAEAAEKKYLAKLNGMEQALMAAQINFKSKADRAIAGLNDLFDLGKQGIHEQMKAHLAGKRWQGEKIDGAAFRSCFRMVTQAVKGLGLPTGDQTKARESIMSELAASLASTQKALSLSADPDDTPPGMEN